MSPMMFSHQRMKLLLDCLLIFDLFGSISGELLCLPGTRLHTTKAGIDTCTSCKDGVNFISERQHSHRKCHACTQMTNPDLEIIVSNCSRTRDTVIICKQGYYRLIAMNSRDKDECVKCTECESPKSECQVYHDTVCCAPNNEAVLSGDKYICQTIPVVCGPGYYLKEITQECLACPDGTYMTDNVHTYTQCLKCGVLSGELTHAVIIRPCYKTSPTLFGCEPGYFRDPDKESLQIETTCSPCQKCHKQLKECDMFHDTICGNKTYPEREAVINESSMDDLRNGHETGDVPNRYNNIDEWQGKPKQDIPEERTATLVNNDPILDDNNDKSDSNDHGTNISYGKKDDEKNMFLRLKNTIIIIYVLAAAIEGFISVSFLCISLLSRSYKTRYNKFPFNMYKRGRVTKYVMLISTIHAQLLCTYPATIVTVEAGYSISAVIVSWLILFIVTGANTLILLKIQSFFFAIDRRDD